MTNLCINTFSALKATSSAGNLFKCFTILYPGKVLPSLNNPHFKDFHISYPRHHGTWVFPFSFQKPLEYLKPMVNQWSIFQWSFSETVICLKVIQLIKWHNIKDDWERQLTICSLHTVFTTGSFIWLIAWLSLYGKINVTTYKDNNLKKISWKYGSILQKAEKHSRQCLIMLLSTQGKILELIFISVLLLWSAGILSELGIQKWTILWSPRHTPDLCWETSRQAIRKWHAANTLPYCSWKHRYFYLSDAIHQVCLQELQMADGREKHSHGRFVHASAGETCRSHWHCPKVQQIAGQVWQPTSQHRGRYQNWTRSVWACKGMSNVCCKI